MTMTDDQVEQAITVNVSRCYGTNATRGSVTLAGAEGAITVARIDDETLSVRTDVGETNNRIHFAITIKVTDRKPVGGGPNRRVDRRPETSIAVSKRDCKNIAASIV